MYLFFVLPVCDAVSSDNDRPITQRDGVTHQNNGDLNYNYVKLTQYQLNIKKYPIKGLDRPRGFQKVEATRFQDNQHV